uniref:Uncharacterized protein n=1 Tax=Anguilla anguilla TaxID=7936 RepID=A0A0E9V6U3_ANGAN
MCNLINIFPRFMDQNNPITNCSI